MGSRHLVIAALLTTALTVGVEGGSRAGAADVSFCSRATVALTAGDVAEPQLIELSGLAASHAHPGVLWANNDSGDTARVFAMSDTGASLGIYDVPGANAIDWEDVATGPGPTGNGPYLFIGDIGDNAAARDHVTVYRVPEPATMDGAGGSLTGVEAFDLVYPGGPEDAESLFVDPLSRALFIVTKQISGMSKVLSVDQSALTTTGPTTMTQVAQLNIADTGAFDPAAKQVLPATMATAADISPDGSVILVRTYQQVLAYARAPGQSVGEAMAGVPCSAPQAPEPQGEAIAFSADGDAYFTSGEVQLARESGAMAATDPLLLVRIPIGPLPGSVPSPSTLLPTTILQPSTTPSTEPPPTESPTTEPAASEPPTEPATTEPATTSAPATSTASPVPAVAATPVASRSSSSSSGHAGWWIGLGVLVVLGGILVAFLLRRRGRVGT